MKTAADIAAFGRSELLTSEAMIGTTLDEQLEKLFMKELGDLQVARFSEAYERSIGTFRQKELIFSYLASLKSQGPEDVSYFKEIVKFILEGTFATERYKVPHLQMMAKDFDTVIAEWKKGEYKLKESDLLQNPVASQRQISISQQEMYNKCITDQHLDLGDDSPLVLCLRGTKTQKESLEELQTMVKNVTDNDILRVQIACLKLIDPELTPENKKKYLKGMQGIFKKVEFAKQEFKNDVEGWLKSTAAAPVKVDCFASDTDNPNDLLLLGEEV